jgi:hypothetical protein
VFVAQFLTGTVEPRYQSNIDLPHQSVSSASNNHGTLKDVMRRQRQEKEKESNKTEGISKLSASFAMSIPFDSFANSPQITAGSCHISPANASFGGSCGDRGD